MTRIRLPEPARARGLRLLHLGDSYTCSEGIDPAMGWPALLKQHLEATGSAIQEQQIVARTGWTSGELLAALEADPPGSDWDLITLCIGVNDQYRGLPVEAYSRDLHQLMILAEGLSNRKYHQHWLLGVPDWGVSPFANSHNRHAIALAIEGFNQAACEVAMKRNWAFLDWTAQLRSCASNPGAWASDGLHPSARQHANWAALLCNLIEA